MKVALRKAALVLSVMYIIAFASPMLAYGGSLDGYDDSSSGYGNNGYNSGSSENGAIADYLSGYNPISSTDMDRASKLATPIANWIGTASGVIMIGVSAGIFLITALDMVYIAVPFLRHFLNPAYSDMPMQGGGMSGMGMGMPGMGMAQPQAAPGGFIKHRLVSDEADLCVKYAQQQSGAGAAAAAQPMGGMGMGGMGMGGMGMGGMGMGMGGMGGMGMSPQPQGAQPMPTKSIILMYLKKRAFFLVIFAVASIVLMSSIFTDCGINLAALITKLMNKANGAIGGVNV